MIKWFVAHKHGQHLLPGVRHETTAFSECKLYSCLPSATWEQAQCNKHTHASTNLDNRVNWQTQ